MSSDLFSGTSFQGKTYVVTGGGSGLGRAMSEKLLSCGAQIVIFGRREEVLQKTKVELEKTTGGKVLAVSGDVRKPEDVARLYRSSIEAFGCVDGLINNAAGNFVSPTERLSPNAFSAVVDIVLKGSFHCTLEFGKNWIAAQEKDKVILSIATTYALTGSAYVVPSACAKSAVITMTKSLAAEWAKYGIRLHAVAPGLFPTEGAMSRLVPQALADKVDLSKRIPIGRVGRPDELTNLTAFLLSDHAKFMSGECLTIDGGELLKGAGQFNFLDDIPGLDWNLIESQVRAAKK